MNFFANPIFQPPGQQRQPIPYRPGPLGAAMQQNAQPNPMLPPSGPEAEAIAGDIARQVRQGYDSQFQVSPQQAGQIDAEAGLLSRRLKQEMQPTQPAVAPQGFSGMGDKAQFYAGQGELSRALAQAQGNPGAWWNSPSGQVPHQVIDRSGQNFDDRPQMQMTPAGEKRLAEQAARKEIAQQNLLNDARARKFGFNPLAYETERFRRNLQGQDMANRTDANNREFDLRLQGMQSDVQRDIAACEEAQRRFEAEMQLRREQFEADRGLRNREADLREKQAGKEDGRWSIEGKRLEVDQKRQSLEMFREDVKNIDMAIATLEVDPNTRLDETKSRQLAQLKQMRQQKMQDYGIGPLGAAVMSAGPGGTTPGSATVAQTPRDIPSEVKANRDTEEKAALARNFDTTLKNSHANSSGNASKFFETLPMEMTPEQRTKALRFAAERFGPDAVKTAIQQEMDRFKSQRAKSVISQLFGYQVPRSWAVDDSERNLIWGGNAAENVNW